MSADSVIADVGESIIHLLQEQMADMVSPDAIALQSPGDLTGQNIRLSLFLYHLEENAYLKNQAVDPAYGYTRLPPLTLDLSYMLTTFSYLPNLTERSLEEHRLLGRAMRILHDYAELTGSTLQGGLASSEAKLKITMVPASVQHMAEIWNTFPDHHYRPSACYVVTPVVIDSSSVVTPKLVKTRDLRYSSLDLKNQ